MNIQKVHNPTQREVGCWDKKLILKFGYGDTVGVWGGEGKWILGMRTSIIRKVLNGTKFAVE